MIVVVVVVCLVVCAGMWPDPAVGPLPIPPGPETVVVLPVNPRLFGVKRIRMSEMDLWHIPECPQSPHVR